MANLPMNPDGWRGRLFGVVMEYMNRQAYRETVTLLSPRARERFLEIGFGTGALVERLLAHCDDLEICGVDPTPTMLSVASKRRAVLRARANVDLRRHNDNPLPWPDHHFDGVAALHSFQFWARPNVTANEIERVLRPTGKLILVLRDHSRGAPEWLPNPVSRSGDEPRDAAKLLENAGFRVEQKSPVGTSAVLVAWKRNPEDSV